MSLSLIWYSFSRTIVSSSLSFNANVVVGPCVIFFTNVPKSMNWWAKMAMRFDWGRWWSIGMPQSKCTGSSTCAFNASPVSVWICCTMGIDRLAVESVVLMLCPSWNGLVYVYLRCARCHDNIRLLLGSLPLFGHVFSGAQICHLKDKNKRAIPKAFYVTETLWHFIFPGLWQRGSGTLCDYIRVKHCNFVRENCPYW